MSTNAHAYPTPLQRIVDYFGSLDEQTRRARLIDYADQAMQWHPKEGEKIVLEDLRNDDECMDEVGIYIIEREGGKIAFRLYFGDEVQTLNKAMGVILGKGLEDTQLQDVINLSSQVVTQIIGQRLVRYRSQTVYYILNRMKSAARQLRDKRRP